MVVALAHGALRTFGAQAGQADVVPLAPSNSVARLLPDGLAGFKASSDVRQVASENLSELVSDKAAIYREYRVTSAASREYGNVRVDVFETRNRFAAFGLFSSATGKQGSPEDNVGSGGARVNRDLVFWKESFFVRVGDRGNQDSRGSFAVHRAIARAVDAAIIPSSSAIAEPPLLDSLPPASILPDSKCYFMGPEALNAYVQHGREMFAFEGDTEAVIASYAQGTSPVAQSDGSADDSLLKLVIVECHTPQFATDAMARASEFLSSLPEDEQQRIIVKRTGNYIVEAANVRDRGFAQGLVDSVQYPYTVKWLRNPLWPTNDPFRAQKAAQMLLSTFGLLGLILMTVLAVGSIFGTTIFLKRRKRQQEVFSDAGGMLRLELDQFESVILGLPPKRSEE